MNLRTYIVDRHVNLRLIWNQFIALKCIKNVSRHTLLYPEAHFVQWDSSLKRMQDLLMRTYKLLR